MNSVNNINNLTLNLKNSELNLKVGDKVNINILKSISKDLYLINIKGKLLNAAFKNQPTLSKYIGKVISTEPFLEIKLEKDETTYINKFKKFFINFDKNLIKSTLLKFGQNDLKKLDAAELKKLIKNSGLIFESKLLKNENIDDDLKAVFYKNNDNIALDSITKLQVTTILNQALFFTFSAKNFNIDDGEVIYKKGHKSNSVYLKANFSELKNVVIILNQKDYLINGVIKTEMDISKLINEIDLPNINLRWEKLEETDLEKFNIFKSSISKIGNLQIYA